MSSTILFKCRNDNIFPCFFLLLKSSPKKKNVNHRFNCLSMPFLVPLLLTTLIFMSPGSGIGQIHVCIPVPLFIRAAERLEWEDDSSSKNKDH